MAQWLARGTAVVGVLVLEWVSYGYGPLPASPLLPAPQTQGVQAPAPPAALKNGERSRTFETLAQLPLRFEANAGQFDERIRFAARGVGYGVALTPTGATLSLTSSTGATSAVAMTVVGRDGAPAAARRVDGREPLPGVVNHVIGSDRTRWHLGVELFARVRQAGVYDGIDLEFYGNQQRLEYDFLVAPGADPATIRVRFDGAERVEVDGRGDLLVHVPGGEPLRQQAPDQLSGDRRDAPRGREPLRVARGERCRHRRRRLRSREPLTIDPVLIYSSFFGGTSAEQAFDIALDPSGNIYLAGKILGGGTLPVTPGAFQATPPGLSDGFVAKFNATGTALIYCTYIGGSGADMTRSFRPGRMAADAAGNAYIAGRHELGGLPDRRRGGRHHIWRRRRQSQRRLLCEAGTDRRVPLRHLPWRQRLRLDHRHRGRHERQRLRQRRYDLGQRQLPADRRRLRPHREQLRRVPEQVRRRRHACLLDLLRRLGRRAGTGSSPAPWPSTTRAGPTSPVTPTAPISRP